MALAPPENPPVGSLWVTNFRVIWVEDGSVGGATFVPLFTIHQVEKVGGKRQGRRKGPVGYHIRLDCKDMRTLRFGFAASGSSRPHGL